MEKQLNGTEEEGHRLGLTELERTFRSVDPMVLLVPPRILRRVIRQCCGLTGWGVNVPHRKSFVVERKTLLEIVDREELSSNLAMRFPKRSSSCRNLTPRNWTKPRPGYCWFVGGGYCSTPRFTWHLRIGFVKAH